MPRTLLRYVMGAGAAIAALALAQPALGYTEIGHTGVTGPHSLTDTSSSPGVVCRYKPNSTFGLDKLKSLTVAPPKMKAAAGEGPQQVGWRFTVQRRRVGPNPTPWHDKYASPTFKTTTSVSHNASFSSESVDVSVPIPENAGYRFRVIVKLFWFQSQGGPVSGTATEQVGWYTGKFNTSTTVYHHSCSGWVS